LGEERVHYVPNMVPSEALREARRDPQVREEPRVLHVAWQSEAKGTLDVLSVAAEMPTAEFRLVGPMPADFAPIVSEHLAALGNPPNVTFVGERRGSELKAEYAAADLFLFPSRFTGEGFPMVILEAMSHSLPIVATDIGEIGSMLTGQGGSEIGLVVPLGGELVPRLVTAVEELLRDKSRATKLGQLARKKTEENYSSGVVLPQLERILTELV
jgi:glycosyltransferase involved in cell wall biosynthesis